MLNYDTIIIELQSNGKAVSSLSITKSNLDMIIKATKSERSLIIEDLIKQMENPENLKDESSGNN